MTSFSERCRLLPLTCYQLHWEPEAEGQEGELWNPALPLLPRKIPLPVRDQLLALPAQIHQEGPKGNHLQQGAKVKVQGCWVLAGRELLEEEAGLVPST